MTSIPQATSRYTFNTQDLVSEYPPRFTNKNKRAMYAVACPPGSTHSGQIEYSRWPALRLPVELVDAASTTMELREGYFGYVSQPATASTIEWYLNFAASDLFCAYAGTLFAQDEMQVAEHSALASLREALCARKIPRWTVEQNEPAPILMTGVERRCRIALDRNAKLGRPAGLYGNEFARVSEEAIRAATEAIVPPTITNVLAIEAPAYGNGTYSAQDIAFVLETAYSGFKAASVESRRMTGGDARVVIHLGYWGCGAFGGNRVMMALLQLVGARLAGIDSLVFHYGSAKQEIQRAVEILPGLLSKASSIAGLLGDVEHLGLQWGTSDGN